MKKLIISLIIVAILLCTFLYMHHPANASSAPLPTSIDVSGNIYNISHNFDEAPFNGYELYESGFIQPAESPWVISLNATPLNGTISVSVLGESGYLLDTKHCSDSCTFTESLNQPVRIDIYASSWQLSVH